MQIPTHVVSPAYAASSHNVETGTVLHIEIEIVMFTA